MKAKRKRKTRGKKDIGRGYEEIKKWVSFKYYKLNKKS